MLLKELEKPGMNLQLVTSHRSNQVNACFKCRYQGQNGNIYEGSFFDGQMTGYGVYKYTNGGTRSRI